MASCALAARLLLLTALRTATARKSCPTCGVSLYQNTGFGTQPCGVTDFGCYPDEDVMWVKPPCGGFFRCEENRPVVRCGSRFFKPAPGQERLNCTCETKRRRLQQTVSAHKSHACGEQVSVDPSGGVSAKYRRLPQPGGADPSVKCCRNKPTSRGAIDWNVTLKLTNANYANWPSGCEALCDSFGECRYFSHSTKWRQCILCRACHPEIMIGDDTFASFQRASESAEQSFTGRPV